ncbi:TetR family transcriptional regulator [Leeuwenhoekiella aestuarii]|uniref:TetR family transcriptional regulator n=2 Tax=Leeuwenhoekiella TaxID=283735 RepID=A0A4Q0NW78_9FLAO|nr:MULTISPECIES: TetR/AcrR family transcriptional regulator [Leeuwenhoekiella]RXG15866.1 TetR family transcriptional regulator [Leeuwenhoekiella aestuarii]RXG16543.1 TetR family transcriptional regulator [Leeuwenhoekiella aestuarii]RXG26549.1 TetR family transcriptional regulator [Leeuwenhoekiella polynyae]
MNDLLRNLKISINESIYLKDPESSDLGKRIVEHGILLINELGFDNFTFKKLGEHIQSNESSIYRYFENKHKFLIYLTNWYWGWKEYQLAFATINIKDPKHKLNQAIEILTREVEEDQSFNHINEVALNKIVINEYSKSYLTKEVDDENKEGYFLIYKRLSNRLKEMIADVNEGYPYPSSLASTILAGSLHQHFLKDHFTSLTDCGAKTSPSQYFIHLTSNLLNS